MKKETIIIREKDIAVKVQNSKVNAIRTKDISRKAVRVYDNNYLGVSGAVGETSLNIIEQQAIENLQTKIAYPYALTKNLKDHRNYIENYQSEKDFVSTAETIVETLRSNFDDFIFSETIDLKEVEHQFKNSENLDLVYKDQIMNLGLLVKEKSSANLFDTVLMYSGRHFDINQFVAFNKKLLNACRHKVALPKKEKLPVFMIQSHQVKGFLMRNLNGEVYANGGSLFDKKVGETLFNKKITLIQNYDSKIVQRSFFDNEGCVLENDQLPLIENGMLKRVFTDKKTAAKHNLEHTASASGNYDDIPKVTGTSVTFKTDSTELKKVLGNQRAILVILSAGGDFNADGKFASPVQSAYLFDGEEVLGKLPEFSIESNIYDMLGEDYIGTFAAPNLYFSDQTQIQGFYLTIKA